MTDTQPEPKGMTADQVAHAFAMQNADIAQGEKARTLRERLIKSLYAADSATWTQIRLAKEAGISQAAVSKLLSKKQYAFDWNFDPSCDAGRVRAADLEEAVELALKAAGLERGPGDYDDPEEGLYNSGYLVVRGASESRGGGWVAVYEPETIRAHRPQLG